MDFLRPDGKQIEINSKEEAADHIRKSCDDCKKYDYTMHTCPVRSYLFCMHMRAASDGIFRKGRDYGSECKRLSAL